MARSGSQTPVDPGGTVMLRPHGASLITIMVAVLVVVLSAEALLRRGAEALWVLPLPALVITVVWALLWAPRVVLHEDSVEVRNVVVTHHLPFSTITDVRLGAMLRFDVVDEKRGPQTVTAWNAPALRRDNPLRREQSFQQANHHRGFRAPRMGPDARLLADQQSSRAYVVRQRWSAWLDRQGDPDPSGHTGTSPNVLVIAVVGICAALFAARLMAGSLG